MIGCIYHEADLDGVMSAAIVNKYFKRRNIDLLPYNYGKEIPDVSKYDKVFVVDVSFGDRTSLLFDEWKDKGIDVTWIDHHKTAIEAVKDYNVKGKRRIGTAACELTDPTLRYLRNYEAKRVEGREDLALRISIIW